MARRRNRRSKHHGKRRVHRAHRRSHRRHGRYWIQGALGVERRCHSTVGPHHRKRCRKEARHKGALHRQLGIPVGEKIPLHILEKAAKAPGKLGKRARLALNLRRFHHRRRSSR